MHFKTNDFNKDGVKLYSTNVDLKERWLVFSPKQMSENTGSNWSWFRNIKSQRSTKLHLVYDDVVGKPAIAKTISYRPDDLISPETVEIRRKVLLEQIQILNEINSPLLPEPLDWFYTRNTVDPLDSSLKDSEPILILDYLPGITLSHKQKYFKFPGSEQIDAPRVARIAVQILQFLRILDEYGYAYLDLNPDHILLLNNDIPRFVGIGSICPTNSDGNLDSSHINFWSTSRGYSAPELLDATDDWKRARQATPAQVGAFSLGVVLHQIFTENVTIEKEMIQEGAFFYPNGISEITIKQNNGSRGELIHKLILSLCEHDPNKRLADFDEIEDLLWQLEGGTKFRVRKKKESQRRQADRKKARRKREQDEARKREQDEARRREQDEARRREQDEARKREQDGARRREQDEARKREQDGARRREQDEARRREQDEARKREQDEARRREQNEARRKREQDEARRREQDRELQKREKRKRSEWCFLSTAAYGSSTEANLDTLRWFRDSVLRPRAWGRKLLAQYVKSSPDIARRLERMNNRKKIIRKIINLAVKLIKRLMSESSKSPSYWGLTLISIAIYYTAFVCAFLFVVPEKIKCRLLNMTVGKGEK